MSNKKKIDKNIFIFDLDGTIIESEEGIINSVIYMLKKRGMEIPDRKELRKIIGPTLRSSFTNMFGIKDKDIELAINDYREHYSKKGVFECYPYDGIGELLERLKSNGKIVSLATAKPEKYAIEILKHFDLYKYFDIARGSDLSGLLSEKTDIISAALNDIFLMNKNLSPSDAIMIGDRKFDILGALENGIDSIGVLYGYGSREELESAGGTYIAETVKDLKGLIL